MTSPISDPTLPTRADRVSRGRPRLVVSAVIGAFVLPILVAWAAAFGFLPGWTPAQVNQGLLLPSDTRLPLSGASSEPLQHQFGQWSVVVLTAPDCAPPCLLDDQLMHRFAQAMAADAERVFIYRAGVHPRQPPGVRPLPMTEAERAALVGLIDEHPLDAIILDYQRRPVLAYPAPAQPASVMADLRRLLRASRTP